MIAPCARLTLSRVQVAGCAHQQRGHGHQQRHRRRLTSSPGAHSSRSAGTPAIRARHAGPLGTYSVRRSLERQALGAARPSLPRRWLTGRLEGPGDSPGKSTQASAASNTVARPADYNPGSPRPGPVSAIAESRAHRGASPGRVSRFSSPRSSGWVALCGV